MTICFLLGAAKRRLAVEEQFEAAVQGSARRLQTLCQGVHPSRPTLVHQSASVCIISSIQAGIACHLLLQLLPYCCTCMSYSVCLTCWCFDLQLSLLHCIRNPSKALRQTVGTSIAVIVGLGTLTTWPELVPACVQGLEGSDINALEGSLDALFKVSTHDCT